MNYNLSIQKILLNVTNSNLDDQITLLKDAIKIADANSDLNWGYDLRTQLIDKYSYTSRSPIEFLVYFAWLLDAEDSDPSLSDNDYSLNIYPWILSSMCNTVSVSREQIDLVLQDYKTRLEKKGHTLKGYLESLVYWEIFKGNANEAKGYFEEYVKFCTKNSRVEEYALFMRMRIELISGDLDKALWYAKDITNPATHHSIMKLYTYSVLTSYMTKEKDSRATEMFEETEKEFRIITKSKSSASIMAIADMLCYLSRHDQDKAWDYFSDYIYQTISLEDDTRLSFFEKVLPLFKDQDRKTLQIPHQLPYYKAEGIYDLKDVYDYYYVTAKLLSNQFDERNGTNFFTKELNKSLKG